MMLQYKHNICTLSENIEFMCTSLETGEKSSPYPRLSSSV